MYMYEFTNIIYLYLIVTVCLIGFNIWYVWHEKLNEKKGEKKKKKYREIILDAMNDRVLSKKEQNYYYRQLKNVNKFLWFDAVVEDLRRENSQDVEKFIIKLTPVFQKLAVHYRSRDSIQKAFFAHILSIYPNMSNNSTDRIFQSMMEFTHDDSIYCRENSMTYFYNNGTVENIVHALRTINDNGLFYSQKLLTDDLLKFHGDKEELADSLLTVFDDFNVEFQVSIINFLRMLKPGREKKIYELYSKHKYDKEVELAMIRYFGRHKYELLIDDFVKLMKNKDEDNDEYRIITASTLASYDSAMIRHILIESLSDTNWYVRKNSATSLARMHITDKEIKTIENSKDRYAKEMVSYVWGDLDMKDKISKKKEKKGNKKHVSVH